MPLGDPGVSKEAETSSKVEFGGLVGQNSFKIETTLKTLKKEEMAENFPRSEPFLLSLYWLGNLSSISSLGRFANLKKIVSKIWDVKNRV